MTTHSEPHHPGEVPEGVHREGAEHSEVVGATSDDRANRTERRRRPSGLLPALLVGLLVALAAGVFLMQRPATYTSTRNVVVVPQKVDDLQQSAALFDTLSRGQVIATAAEMYGEQRWNPAAGTVEVTAGNVAPSAVVQVTAAGKDAATVRSTLDTVVRAATPEISRVLAPYTVQTLEDSASEPEAAGLSLPVKGVLALLAGLVAAVLTAAAVRAVTGGRER